MYYLGQGILLRTVCTSEDSVYYCDSMYYLGQCVLLGQCALFRTVYYWDSVHYLGQCVLLRIVFTIGTVCTI